MGKQRLQGGKQSPPGASRIAVCPVLLSHALKAADSCCTPLTQGQRVGKVLMRGKPSVLQGNSP